MQYPGHLHEKVPESMNVDPSAWQDAMDPRFTNLGDSQDFQLSLGPGDSGDVAEASMGSPPEDGALVGILGLSSCNNNNNNNPPDSTKNHQDHQSSRVGVADHQSAGGKEAKDKETARGGRFCGHVRGRWRSQAEQVPGAQQDSCIQVPPEEESMGQ